MRAFVPFLLATLVASPALAAGSSLEPAPEDPYTQVIPLINTSLGVTLEIPAGDFTYEMPLLQFSFDWTDGEPILVGYADESGEWSSLDLLVPGDVVEANVETEAGCETLWVEVLVVNDFHYFVAFILY